MIGKVIEILEKLYNALVVNKNAGVQATLTGSTMEHYGATVATRPAANEVPVGSIFMAVQTQEVWQSDGANWVVLQ